MEAAATVLKNTVAEGRLNLAADEPPTKTGRRTLRGVLFSLALLEAERGIFVAASQRRTRATARVVGEVMTRKHSRIIFPHKTDSGKNSARILFLTLA